MSTIGLLIEIETKELRIRQAPINIVKEVLREEFFNNRIFPSITKQNLIDEYKLENKEIDTKNMTENEIIEEQLYNCLIQSKIGLNSGVLEKISYRLETKLKELSEELMALRKELEMAS